MRCLLLRPSHLFYLLFVLTTWSSIAQNRLSVSEPASFVSMAHVDGLSDTLAVTAEQPVSAIAIKSSSSGPFYYLSPEKDRVLIPADPDVESTFFLSLPRSGTSFEIISEEGASYDLYLIKSGEAPEILEYTEMRLDQAPCEKPTGIIPQSSWREGLPEPSYNRAFTEVNHMIVHHSAGSNVATDYTQVVRDIYLYHTQVNGWSDIGYNYLVAQDGSIYAGRDPDDGDQLTVRGAHFCGSNTGTSGVCLLGNYEEADPTGPALDRLTQLLTYGFARRSLTPFATSPHSTGNLTSLAGHRDGCATLCPGENLYVRMDDLRSAVAQNLEDCGLFQSPEITFEISENYIPPGSIVRLTNTTDSSKDFNFLTPDGIQLPVLNSTRQVDVRYDEKGVFSITLEAEINGIEYSSTVDSAVVVIEAVDELYPNPIQAGEILHLTPASRNSTVKIIDLQGRIRASLRAEAGQIRIPDLDSGVYVIEVAAAPAISKRWKLIVE